MHLVVMCSRVKPGYVHPSPLELTQSCSPQPRSNIAQVHDGDYRAYPELLHLSRDMMSKWLECLVIPESNKRLTK